MIVYILNAYLITHYNAKYMKLKSICENQNISPQNILYINYFESLLWNGKIFTFSITTFTHAFMKFCRYWIINFYKINLFESRSS